MRWSKKLVAQASSLLIAVLAPTALFAQTNLDFETPGTLGSAPPGWTTSTSPAGLTFQARLVAQGCIQGKQCAQVTGPPNPASGSWGYLLQSAPAAPFSGTVRFRAAVRTDGSSGTFADLYVRVNRADGTTSFVIESTPRAATGWEYGQVSAPVASDASSITIGFVKYGGGSAWLDDASLQNITNTQPEAARPLSTTGLGNLTAFAKALGYVRHFHPSDAAAQTDWEAFAVHGARAVEDAATPSDLAAQLQALLNPIAPTVQVFPTGNPPGLPVDLTPASLGGLQFIRWNNYGVEISYSSQTYGNIYTSTRQTAAASSPLPAAFVSPTQPYVAEIGQGLSISAPLTLYADVNGTLPHQPIPSIDCCTYSPDDRGTRLGGVIVAWNAPQHFWPYFDVMPDDWPGALAAALASAATDSGAGNYLITLKRLWAALRDGHGFVSGPTYPAKVPVVWDWVENQLVVTAVLASDAQGVSPGDRVLQIDGVPAEDVLAQQEALISGATPQFILSRARIAAALCNSANQMQLTIEPYAKPGSSRTVEFACSSSFYWAEPALSTQELEPGIEYINLVTLTSAAWTAELPALSSAKGIVFDMRGGLLVSDYLQYLSLSNVIGPQMWVPTPSRPDQVGVAFQQLASWNMPPLQPYLPARRVFLTNGSNISFAETVMDMVEANRLAEIVGGPTAGSNGNINYVYLPGGYSLGFTGMKVLKNDGSQHHGVGIHPTIPASRTRAGVAAGVDEVLARGVAVVQGPQPGPTPQIYAVANAASFAAGTVAPGEIVTIFGINLGPDQLSQTSYDGSGYLGTYAGETRVFFDNIQAPLVYASALQVSAIVPYQVSASTNIRVEYQLRSSAAVAVPVAASAPGIFAYGGTTRAVVVNQDYTFNSDTNPAARGDVVTLFATGEGPTSPAGVTGKMPRSGSWPAPVGAVSVTFGGVAGDVQWVGEIYGGVLQINVTVPGGAPIGSAVPLKLAVGTAASGQTTVAVK